MHFHGLHKSEMDGVFNGVAPGGKFVYEFIAEPFWGFSISLPHTTFRRTYSMRSLWSVYC